MIITEIIEKLEVMKYTYRDLSVMIRVDEDHGFPYYEVESINPILNEKIYGEDDTREGEILNFIALEYT